MRYLTVLALLVGLTALFNSVSPFHEATVHKTIAYGLSPQTVAKRFILHAAQLNDQAVQITSCETFPVAFAQVAVKCIVLYDGDISVDVVIDLTRSTWQVTPGS